MSVLGLLVREGAMEILKCLCSREARFKDLSSLVQNTRTLSRRLKELTSEGLIQKNSDGYGITDEGFEAVVAVEDIEARRRRWIINLDELEKVRYGWIRVSLRRLSELLLKEFSDELVAIVLYGSVVKESFQPGRSDIDILYILEDSLKNVWRREGRVFRAFHSTWEYRASDHQLRRRDAYRYPDVTATWLKRSHAKMFQPIYLGMLSDRAVLYDAVGFFQKLMKRLEEELKALGSIRIQYPDGKYGWSLKPDLAPGQLIEITLG